MINENIVNEIAISFLGSLFALILAVIAWIIKTAYSKHQRQMKAISKLEKAFILNLEAVKDNLEFLNNWIKSAKDEIAFSCDFEDYILIEEEVSNLSDLKTINQLVPIFYRLKRSSKDLKNIYNSYWEFINKIDSIENEEIRNDNLKALYKNTWTQLEVLVPNYNVLQKNLISAIAHIRRNFVIRKFSFFIIIDYLLKDIWPKINTKNVLKEETKIKKEIENKKVKASKN